MYASLDVAEKIKQLAKSKNISVKQILVDTGLNYNLMTHMRSSMPKADNLARIADYLNCSVDYLLGRTDNPESHLLSAAPSDAAPSTAQQLMDTFSQLSKGDQLILLGEAMNLLETRNSTSVAADGEAPGKHSPSSGTGGHAEPNEKEKPA